MGVNAAALVHHRFGSKEKVRMAAAIPIAGFAIDSFIWLNLSHAARILGAIWIAIGVALYFVMRQRSPQGSSPELNFD